MRTAVIVLLIVLAVGYLSVLIRAVRGWRSGDSSKSWIPTGHQSLVGFVTNFFDTLGIGNFAPTTAWFRAARMVPDEKIPGTLNAGHTLPVMLMGVLFIDRVEVESVTLSAMLASSVVGAWLGAGWVARLPRRRIQLGMGISLLIAVVFMAGFELYGKPAGADALGLSIGPLVGGCVGIAMLGALMTIGVGLYAPCMVLVSLLGMNPIAAFPIMMGACAFLMPFASTRFVQERAFAVRPALGLTLGGIPGVLLAVYVVKSLPLDILRGVVAVVIVITASMMLRAGLRDSASSASDSPPRSDSAGTGR